MTVTVSITESALFTAVGTVLGQMLPTGVALIQGQQNRASLPTGPFAVMTPMLRERLSTNLDTYTNGNPGTRSSTEAAKITVQVDIYGTAAGDNAQIVSTLWRDAFACDAFNAINTSVQPLYASEPRQMQFVNDQSQYENRWSVDVMLQANIAVVVPQQSAIALVVDLINVDATYPTH